MTIYYSNLAPQDRKGSLRTIALWMGSYAIIAVVMIFYFHAPLYPVLFAGLATLALTLVRVIFAPK